MEVALLAATTRNITLSLPDDLIRRARRVALEREVSLSALVRELLEEAVAAADGYEAARTAALATLRQGLSLGTAARIPWTRDQLHERR